MSFDRQLQQVIYTDSALLFHRRRTHGCCCRIRKTHVLRAGLTCRRTCMVSQRRWDNCGQCLGYMLRRTPLSRPHWRGRRRHGDSRLQTDCCTCSALVAHVVLEVVARAGASAWHITRAWTTSRAPSWVPSLRRSQSRRCYTYTPTNFSTADCSVRWYPQLRKEVDVSYVPYVPPVTSVPCRNMGPTKVGCVHESFQTTALHV